MAEGRIRTGLVGFGYAGRTFHAPLIECVEGLELAAVASSDPAKVHAHRPGQRVVPDLAALLEDEAIELVVIATPNELHFEQARAALEAGRHVVVDKPFTVTLEEARTLVRLADRRQRVLSVFHNRRWDGDFLTLQALARAGTLGRLVSLESRFDRFRPEVRPRWRESGGAGSGLWFDLGPHLLDQALRLFGWPQSLWLDRERLREGAVADDAFVARLRYERLSATLQAGTLVAAAPWRLALHGTAGSAVTFGLDGQEDVLRAHPTAASAARAGRSGQALPGRLVLGRPDGTLTESPLVLQPGDYPAYYAGVAAAVRGQGADPVPARQALDVMALIEAGLRSDRERREVEVGPAPSAEPAEAAEPD